MLKLNLKIAWRNLLKHKNYALVNIIGLSLGLAGFVFILLFINHERSYDSWNPELKNIYQLQEYSDYFSSDKQAHLQDQVDYRLLRATRQLPEVKVATIINPAGKPMGVTISGKSSFLQSGFRRSDSLFFKVFPFEFKYGNAETAFRQPETVVLKESVARRYFGDVNPVGKTINIAGGAWNKEENPYLITGVVKEPQSPTVVQFEGIIYEGSYFFNVDGDDGSAAEVYIRTISLNSVTAFNQHLQQVYLPLKDQFLKERGKSLEQSVKEGKAPYLKAVQLGDVYQTPLTGENWQQRLKPVILLVVLLLLVAIINFVNLATAQAATRAKEIGVKKVMGAQRKTLVVQFLAETFIQCIIAMFMALLLIEISLPALNRFFQLDLSLFTKTLPLSLFAQLSGIVIVVGLLTGFYPSLFLSAYRPAEVLKGNFMVRGGGRWVKKALVTVQFVVAVGFMITVLMVNKQLKYLKERDSGFTADNLINIRSYMVNGKYHEAIKNIDGVQYVGYSSGVIGDNIARIQPFKYNNEVKEMYGLGLSIDGLQALDARLVEGRMFSTEVVRDTIDNAIINESAARLFNENMIGKTIIANDSVGVNIIGVVKDIQVEGFESAVKPSIYYVQTEKYKGGVGGYHKQTTLIRFDPEKRENVIRGINRVFQEMNSYYPVNYTFVDDDVNAVLANHVRFEKMLALFSVLSFSLSLFGLFALAAFIIRQRTKEIALRKVLGAEKTDLLLMLNKGQVAMVIIANLIAFPLTYIFITNWLNSFAYRIEMNVLPFALAFLASLIVTIITVSLQAGRTLKASPVQALKYE